MMRIERARAISPTKKIILLKAVVISIVVLFSAVFAPAESHVRENGTTACDDVHTESDHPGSAKYEGTISSTLASRSIDLFRSPQPGFRVIEQLSLTGVLPPSFASLGSDMLKLPVRRWPQREPSIRQQLQLIYPHHDFW